MIQFDQIQIIFHHINLFLRILIRMIILILMTQQSLDIIFNKAKTKESAAYLSKLLAYGRQRGFENFLHRKQIWPFLLGIDTKNMTSDIFEWEGEMDKNSSDYQQLQKDAERSLSSMKTFENITKFHLQKKQRDVLKVLDSFFAKNLNLKYIQGFHDVASIFLVIFGSSRGYYMMQKAGKTYFKDYLTQDLGTIGTRISKIIMELLLKRDKDFTHIFECFQEMNMLPFIISWVLTWYAHVFTSVKTICRIWDYILSTGPHGIIYMTTGVILVTKDALVSQCPQLDIPSIQMFYQQKAKRQQIDINKAISLALQLETYHNIQKLQSYKSIDASSMLVNATFQLQNDIHRIVRQYDKAQSKKQTLIRSSVYIISILMVAVLFSFGFSDQ